MRRICLIAICLAVLCWQAVVFAGGDVRALTLTWSEDPATTQTITWQTVGGGEAKFLSYGKVGEPPVVVQAQTAAFWTEVRQNFVHSVTLRGLEPDTAYSYAVGDGAVWLESGRFVTAAEPSKSFQFLLFSDSQSYDYGVWGGTFSAACERYPQAKFFAVTGDLVDNGQTQAEWDAWFAAAAPYMARLPLVPVVGNHETYTPSGHFSLPIYFKAQFKLPQNGPQGMEGQAYSFDYGAVHFVVLDTQFGEERAFLPDSLERQQEWLRRDLAATDQRWKIIFMHRPVYHNRVQSGQEAAALFRPIFDEYGVDMVFSGHDHVAARTAKLKHGAYHASGTVYMPLGRSGTKVYGADRMEAKSWNEAFFNPVDQPVYQVVSVKADSLEVEVFGKDGTLVDRVMLEK